MAELPGAKNKNNNNGHEKGHKRNLFLVFHAVALISSAQYKNLNLPPPLS
jgi:hypothetical protein